jgi:hypothetical protein
MVAVLEISRRRLRCNESEAQGMAAYEITGVTGGANEAYTALKNPAVGGVAYNTAWTYFTPMGIAGVMYPETYEVEATGNPTVFHGAIEFTTQPQWRPSCSINSSIQTIETTRAINGVSLPTDADGRQETATIMVTTETFVVEQIEDEALWFGNIDGTPNADGNRLQRARYAGNRTNAVTWRGDPQHVWLFTDYEVERMGDQSGLQGRVRVRYHFQRRSYKNQDDEDVMWLWESPSQGTKHVLYLSCDFASVLHLHWPDGSLIT